MLQDLADTWPIVLATRNTITTLRVKENVNLGNIVVASRRLGIFSVRVVTRAGTIVGDLICFAVASTTREASGIEPLSGVSSRNCPPGECNLGASCLTKFGVQRFPSPTQDKTGVMNGCFNAGVRSERWWGQRETNETRRCAA